MNKDKLKTFLNEKTVLFEEFPEDRMTELIDGSFVKTFEENEGIVDFGEEGHFLGVMLEGEAISSVTNNSGEQNILMKIKVGELIGLIPMMTGELNMSDIIGVKRCKVLVIPQTLFTTLILTHLPSVQCISRIMSQLLHKYTTDDEFRDLAERAFGKQRDPYGFTLQSSEPVKIFVINCGSTSLKYNLFNTADESLNATGKILRIGTDTTKHLYTYPGGELDIDLGHCDHETAFKLMFEQITSKETGVIRSPYDVVLVGHRVVHGGKEFDNPVVISQDVINKIDSLSPLAPLHNPYNLKGIHKGMEFFTDALHVAVFDTAFHHTMPPYAYLYGLPYDYFEKHGIRRYGFHGMSHAYVSLKAAEVLKKPYNKLEIITCHLDNTSSLCAVDHGRSVDTTMGFSPTEGLIMGTRCGDIDPSAVLMMLKNENLSIDELNYMLNKDSGIKGLSGISNDMSEIIKAADTGDHRALLAFKTFCYKVRKYIGSYIAAMEGIDVLVFTGWIGAGGHGVRSQACQGLQCMGIELDDEKNRNASWTKEPVIISSEKSQVSVMVIPTDEERMIARDSLKTKSTHAVKNVLNLKNAPIPIEVSAHHVHLAQEHVEILYGKGHTLTPIAELSQPGQFACEEQVTLVGPKGKVPRVRVLGPTREETQVEISMTEQFQLGIQPPIRASGNLINTPGIKLEGPEGSVDIDHGVICALRHIHMTPDDAISLGIHDRDIVRVQVHGDRELIFGDVLVRVHPEYKLAMHIDTDEANAAHIRSNVVGHINEIQMRL